MQRTRQFSNTHSIYCIRFFYRAAMSQSESQPEMSEEDAKRIAMRKAIAEKLKQEVIGKN